MDTAKLQQKVFENTQRMIEAQYALDKAKLEQQQQQSRIDRSAKEVTRYLSKVVEHQLKSGEVKPKVVQEYLKRFEGDVQGEYLRLVATLLTNPYQGVTSDASQVFGSTFHWQGQSYDLEGLYEQLNGVLGRAPFQSKYWFYDMLTDAIVDRRQLASDFDNPQTRRFYTEKAKLTDQNYSSNPDYDGSVLTSDDMFLLQCFE